MAKRRRHASSRASALATNSSKGIGRLRAHNPPGDRKSGMPHSVEMPAPVKGTMFDASAIMSPSFSNPLRRSDAITRDHPAVCPVRTIARLLGLSLQGEIADMLIQSSLRRPCGRLLDLVDVLVIALFGLHDRRGALGFLLGFAVLGQLFQFRFQLGLSRSDFLRKLLGRIVAQTCELLD